METDPKNPPLGIVRHAATRLVRRLPATVRYDELYSAGLFALVEAQGRFDAARGVDFATYAKHRVCGAMLDVLRKLDTVSRDRRKAIRDGTVPEGSPPAPRLVDISAAAGVADPSPNAEDELDSHRNLQRVREAIEELPPRLKLVYRLRIVKEQTLRQIADHFGVTEARACQLVAEVVRRVRERMEENNGATTAPHKNGKEVRAMTRIGGAAANHQPPHDEELGAENQDDQEGEDEATGDGAQPLADEADSVARTNTVGVRWFAGGVNTDFGGLMDRVSARAPAEEALAEASVNAEAPVREVKPVSAVAEDSSRPAATDVQPEVQRRRATMARKKEVPGDDDPQSQISQLTAGFGGKFGEALIALMTKLPQEFLASLGFTFAAPIPECSQGCGAPAGTSGLCEVHLLARLFNEGVFRLDPAKAADLLREAGLPLPKEWTTTEAVRSTMKRLAKATEQKPASRRARGSAGGDGGEAQGADSSPAPEVTLTEGIDGMSADQLNRVWPFVWARRRGSFTIPQEDVERWAGKLKPKLTPGAFGQVLTTLRKAGILVREGEKRRSPQHFDFTKAAAAWRKAVDGAKE